MTKTTTSARIQEAISAACRSGNYDNAAEAVLGYEQRTLNSAEAEMIIEAAVAKSDFYNAEKALEVTHRWFTETELETMLEARIKMGNLGLAAFAAEKMGIPLAPHQVERIAAIAIENDAVDQYPWIFSNRQLSANCINLLVDIAVRKGRPNTANFLAQKVGRKISAEEVALIIEICKRDGLEHSIQDAKALLVA